MKKLFRIFSVLLLMSMLFGLSTTAVFAEAEPAPKVSGIYRGYFSCH